MSTSLGLLRKNSDKDTIEGSFGADSASVVHGMACSRAFSMRE